jgi:hypothetical protein
MSTENPTREKLRAIYEQLTPMIEREAQSLVGERVTERHLLEFAARLNTRLKAMVRSGELEDLAWPPLHVTHDRVTRRLQVAWNMDPPNPALRTDEDRQMMAEALLESMREALVPHGPPGAPVGHAPLTLGLSLYAALRVEYPSMTIEEACEAAAATVGAMYRLDLPPSGPHRG